eukprot:364801-Chlamydomonas_euryale.AAC.2
MKLVQAATNTLWPRQLLNRMQVGHAWQKLPHDQDLGVLRYLELVCISLWTMPLHSVERTEPCLRLSHAAERTEPCLRLSHAAERTQPCLRLSHAAERAEPCRRLSHAVERTELCLRLSHAAERTENCLRLSPCSPLAASIARGAGADWTDPTCTSPHAAWIAWALALTGQTLPARPPHPMPHGYARAPVLTGELFACPFRPCSPTSQIARALALGSTKPGDVGSSEIDDLPAHAHARLEARLAEMVGLMKMEVVGQVRGGGGADQNGGGGAVLGGGGVFKMAVVGRCVEGLWG